MIKRVDVLVTILVFLVAAIDCYKYPDKVFKLIGVDSGVILLGFVVLALVLRLKNYQFSNILKKVNGYLVMPASVVLAVSVAIVNDMTSVNYVYSQYGLNIHRLGYMALGSVALQLIMLGDTWWKKNWERAIFWGAVLGSGILFLISLWPFDYFLRLVSEDHLIEYLQFFAVFASGILAWVTSWKVYPKNKFWGICFLLFGAGLLFVAGDEISWGQRLFGLTTPESLSQINAQNEITAHNIKAISPYIWWGYMSVGIVGSLGWMLSAKYFHVPWYAAPYFGALLVYNSLAQPGRIHGIGEWSEVAELAMYMGILIYCVYANRLSRE